MCYKYLEILERRLDKQNGINEALLNHSTKQYRKGIIFAGFIGIIALSYARSIFKDADKHIASLEARLDALENKDM